MVSLVYFLQSIFHHIADNLFQGGSKFPADTALGKPRGLGNLDMQKILLPHSMKRWDTNFLLPWLQKIKARIFIFFVFIGNKTNRRNVLSFLWKCCQWGYVHLHLLMYFWNTAQAIATWYVSWGIPMACTSKIMWLNVFIPLFQLSSTRA
jgi:hypothetical protein